MVRRSSRAVGDDAERRACRFLCGKGLQLVSRNFRCRLGEIDLVMREGECLVFVEVRYRAGRRLASAAQTVDLNKQRKLIRTAALFLSKRPDFATSPVRFDVLAVDVDASGKEACTWISDAFRPADASL